ncbi:uncharacterized protein IL334_004027 [Kwoniella shivajii]|uniref:RRM domain-containing protein n=1 Tax=Kwoniella shivajii TaxID=564305 RepID=A0ABZ1CZ70_9TREE|nr:hypothetical protein IL334_004027 [Kwoniella shivajii]
MTIPLTPAASTSSSSSSNKDLPITPTKVHTFSPNAGKKWSPTPARPSTPTSPTFEADKKTVLKIVRLENVNESAGKAEKSQLNPKSSSFKPVTLSGNAIPDISKLSFQEAGPSTRQTEPVSRHEGPNTPNPNKKNEAPSFETPRRTTRTEAAASTPALTLSPYTPATGDYRLPVTPSTPSYVTPKSIPGKGYEEQNQKTDFHFAAAEQIHEDIGRYLMISNLPLETTENEVRDLIQSVCEFKAIIVKHIRSKGCIFVAFFDAREAMKLYDTLRTSSVALKEDGPVVHLHCMATDQAVVQTIMTRSSGWETLLADSEAIITVGVTGGIGVSVEIMGKTLSAIGELQRLVPVGHEGRRFIAEFFDTRAATQAIQLLDGQKAGQALISISYLHAPLGSAQPISNPTGYTLGSAAYIPGTFSGRALSGRSQSDESTSSDVFGPKKTAQTRSSSHFGTSITSSFIRARSNQDVFGGRDSSSIYSTAPSSSRFSTPTSLDRASVIGSQVSYETPAQLRALGRRLHEPGTVQGLMNSADMEARARQGQGLGGHWNLHDKKAVPPQNMVFPDRILSGLDHRTTVMIKDVPNKLSRQELVDILQSAVPGEFDFVYLRFDFKNCCNVRSAASGTELMDQVGYAFVNFCSIKALYEFIEAKVGKKWNMFSSEKVLQVSYADIQGKSALINKFKNSAVMGVIEAWRPQIFYSNGRMKGQPEPFPDSDNLAVRQRSAAAQLSGFSTPSSYSYGRDDQYYDYPSTHGSAYGV